jgi:hypothetical protein
MINLWQLKKLSTNESLNEPQKLPENWGPIFGLAGIQDRLGDLSWLGEAYADQGWVIVGEAPDDNSQSTVSDIAWNRAKQMLKESDWAVLPDVPMTAGVKAEWIEYRRALREVRLQNGFPTNINWPTKPQ